jgi:hypothetical protein
MAHQAAGHLKLTVSHCHLQKASSVARPKDSKTFKGSKAKDRMEIQTHVLFPRGDLMERHVSGQTTLQRRVVPTSLCRERGFFSNNPATSCSASKIAHSLLVALHSLGLAQGQEGRVQCQHCISPHSNPAAALPQKSLTTLTVFVPSHASIVLQVLILGTHWKLLSTKQHDCACFSQHSSKVTHRKQMLKEIVLAHKVGSGQSWPGDLRDCALKLILNLQVSDSSGLR